MEDHMRFAGGPKGSTSWTYFTADGTLVIEFYDHGEEAEAWFGHDVAFLLHLDPPAQQQFVETIPGDPPGLPDRLASRFDP